jgi:hypothetical protein
VEKYVILKKEKFFKNNCDFLNISIVYIAREGKV